MSKSVGGAVILAVAVVLLLAGGLWFQLGWSPVIAWLLAINLVTPYMFWSDKRKARAGKWRVQEGVLLLLVFLGGSPGGLLASQLLRHKTSKQSFRIQFWIVVALQVALVAGIYYYQYHWQPRPDSPAPASVVIEDSPRTFPANVVY